MSITTSRWNVARKSSARLITWATASGFGTLSRTGRTLSIHCAHGTLSLRALKLAMAAESAHIGSKPLTTRSTKTSEGVTLEFASPVSLAANQTLTIA